MLFRYFLCDTVGFYLISAYITLRFYEEVSWRKTPNFFAAGCAVYFCVVTALNRVMEFEGVLGFFYGAVLIGYAFCALEGEKQEFLIAGVLWVLTALFSTYGIFGMMGIVSGKSMGELMHLKGSMSFYASVSALAVKFFMGKAVTALFRKQSGLHKRENKAVACIFMLMTFLAMDLFCLQMGELVLFTRYLLTIGLLAAETGIVVFLIEIYHWLGKYQQEEMEKQYRQKQEEERLEWLLDMYRIGREINHWRHDMLGELGVLYRMQKNGKYAEVKNYMEKLCSGLKNYPELPQPTGNEGLDAALMKTIPKCREDGIHFCYIILGSPCHFDSIEMGNLMDNLLNNGREACLKASEEKELDLTIRVSSDKLEIYLENSIGESVLEHNPMLISKKSEKERHGFGMESIWRIVEKHEGTYECWEEETKFCQCIYLNMDSGNS